MKPIRHLPLFALFAFGSALAAGASDSRHMQKIDEDQAVELAAKALLAEPALQFDTNFNATGMRAFALPSPAMWSNLKGGVRVFPYTDSRDYVQGYHVAVRQKTSDQTEERMLLVRVKLDGSIDTNFADNGWLDVAFAEQIADVAMDDEGRLYVLHVAATSRVSCTVVSTGAPCFSPLQGDLTGGPQFGTYSGFTPTRLVWNKEYGLYVSGTSVHATLGTIPWIARMADAQTRDGATQGNIVSIFGDSGYVIAVPDWVRSSGVNASINAIAIRSTGLITNQRLYIGGQATTMMGDTDGFIHALNPKTGADVTGWFWKVIHFDGDNTDYKDDAVTALAILRDGGSTPKLVYAGWSKTDEDGVQPMIMGRFTSNGVADASYCAGNIHQNALGVCQVDPPWYSMGFFYNPSSVPVAIVERPNGDLAVAQRFQQNGGFPFDSDHHVRTLVQQFSADGNRLNSSLSVDYPGKNANTDTWWSRPFDMVDARTFAGNRLVLIGTRRWTSVDLDPTVTVLKGADEAHTCVFSDGLEGWSAPCW